MRLSASPTERAHLEPLAWRRKAARSVRVAPLGLGCALLLYAAAVVVYGGLDHLSPLQRILPSPPVSEVEHALTAVRAHMVELPTEGDARTVAQLAGNARMVRLENHHLRAAVHRLEIRYASLAKRLDDDTVRGRESMDQVLRELQRVRDQQNAVAAKLEAAAERTGATVSGSMTDSTAAQPSVSTADVSAEPSIRLAALQIARRLDNTRREALLSKREQTFTIDVESGSLGKVAEGELLQLDPALEIRLDTASSEVINEYSGRIRFFPDGSSTGGRIQLQYGTGGATVNVDWSTGDVTVEMHDD
jgi:general secretion pathway protein H